MTKRPTLLSLKKQIMYISCSQKRIIKEAKFHSQNFDGLARTLLRKCYQIMIIWYAKLAQTKRNCCTRMRMRQFTPRQPPADITVRPQDYKSDPEVDINHDDLYARAWEYDFEQPISTPRTTMRRHLINEKFQYSLISQRRK